MREVADRHASHQATCSRNPPDGGAAGGKGIAVQVDHAKDDQVAALFEQVKREQGRLDLLVNNAFSLPEEIELERAAEFLGRYGITKDALISRMGGSP